MKEFIRCNLIIKYKNNQGLNSVKLRKKMVKQKLKMEGLNKLLQKEIIQRTEKILSNEGQKKQQ